MADEEASCLAPPPPPPKIPAPKPPVPKMAAPPVPKMAAPPVPKMAAPPVPKMAAPPPAAPAPPAAAPAAAAPAAAAPEPPAKPPPAAYQPPAWAVPPSSPFFLEVIKEGVVVEKVEISERDHYVIGRHPSTAQIVVAHPSVSRQHAVIQHRDNGEVYFYDLGSTHGSTVNRKVAPARAYVALRVGAQLRLGGSSRTLCLMGPDDPTREDPEAQKEAAERRAEAAKAEAERRAAARAERIAATTGRSTVGAAELHGGGAGWGFDADAVEEAGADEDPEEAELGRLGYEQLVAQAKAKGLPVSAKQERLIDQLNRRASKLENLKAETERIAAKEVRISPASPPPPPPRRISRLHLVRWMG